MTETPTDDKEKIQNVRIYRRKVMQGRIVFKLSGNTNM